MAALARIALAGAALAASAPASLPDAHAADAISSRDKLRMLYTNRFVFTDDGTPLVTVEIMSGQDEVEIRAGPEAGGVDLIPDGTGAAIRGLDRFTVTAEGSDPALVREWTVIARLGADDEADVDAAMRAWRARGFEPRRFETGSIFGVHGEVLDSRRTLVAIDPVPAPGGSARAARLGQRFGVSTSVHQELARRPRGTVVARRGPAIVENPQVLWFEPARAGATLEVADVITGRGGSNLETGVESRQYVGRIYVTLDRDGKLAVANAVPMDQLLAGLVPSEIFPSAPPEALRAQAIAARTDLLQQIGSRHFADPYLLCSSQHCQVYSGAGHEHPRTTRAVRQTRGQVLLREAGGLIDARYSASCGGHGEHNDVVWGDPADPALRGSPDGPGGGPGSGLARFAEGITEANLAAFLDLPAEATYCGSNRFGKNRHRWDIRISADQVSARVADHTPGVGRVISLEPGERGVSGRLRSLRVRGDRGEVTITGDLAIRRLLGGLRSSLFAVQPIGNRRRPEGFAIRGAGHGHGVGMCQLGAIGMAEAGYKTTGILKHYYPGSRVRRLY
jgi:stage II sporulation protein D